jgi:ABC-type nitrate/sulfonate/bicarbonate transport system substrate-binding protein
MGGKKMIEFADRLLRVARMRAAAGAVGVAVCATMVAVPAGSALAQKAPVKVTLFGQPSVNNDSVWMAIDKGLYQKEGVELNYRLFPSGTTAFQSFQTGQGDIVLTGDLPSVQYFFRVKGDYRTIAVMERDTKGYVAIASKDIKKPQDLVGKTVATRVGSTGSWFISEYLRKNNIDPKTVTVKNLDTQVLPAALCGGEIAAFFIWQPIGSRALEICPDKAHLLTDAGGYIQGYLVAGARPAWLATPEGKDAATRWLRATIEGAKIAAADFPAVAAYAKAKLDLSEKATRDQWEVMERPLALDKVYYDDFCSLSKWAQGDKLLDGPIDYTKLTSGDALKAIDPKRVEAPPPPC